MNGKDFGLIACAGGRKRFTGHSGFSRPEYGIRLYPGRQRAGVEKDLSVGDRIRLTSDSARIKLESLGRLG